MNNPSFNETDFNTMYRLFYEKVFKAAYSITKDTFLAEDIVQETFIKAYKKLDTIVDAGKIGAWLSTIASRTAIDLMRKEKRTKLVPIEDTILDLLDCKNGNITVESEIEITMFSEEVQAEIKHLKPEQREVLLLKYTRGLRDEEIANQLHIKKATVKTRLYRARQQLKSLLLKKNIKLTA
ncbi:RNA polymerase sigma factor [Cytobacillus sp. S13-E01]|uniref:RNA polymerase sigma factor n=1 Tax=Cytobacillus sp. S13-E01 TaxID=3031326 RepID=UPI0023D811F0|nr:RNA polymerase sigma factor [Cytobacillus sp. S13-E01]MDF0728513.1 RNA polymerase sigma factor [Cytobacillus sp. S13-E01]